STPVSGWRDTKAKNWLPGTHGVSCAVTPTLQPAYNRRRRACVCRHAAAKIVGCKRRIEMEDHAMSTIRTGYVVSTRQGFLGLWFLALLALALFGRGAATAQEMKQIKLTDKNIQGLMAAYEEIAKLYEGAESDKPEDPKGEAQATAVAKKHGLASLAQYDDVL